MSLTIEWVEWLDPRAVQQRAAMNVETTAMYADRQEALDDAGRAAVNAALTVPPSDITHTLLVLDDDVVIGHAALRPFGKSFEVKKVFVDSAHRGKGAARRLMNELEGAARETKAASLVLQTGHVQVPAMALYESLGYERIDAFGAYAAIPFGICYEKNLSTVQVGNLS
ncbi:GNAT family N-acetyltransferase [Salinibacterium sp. M195]|uniref:GNAT family N-acetyltransferase n=1 Tax=Salinibacterium sp. M195 TaxID=2583374 RepID=UPI001C638714|nr:GNAT family N-acetyltransferase [Salinibacterium sp. M195]QYH36941.1 GNAT family N-acetyltransferase [Salinibacterium sp. M195]